MRFRGFSIATAVFLTMIVSPGQAQQPVMEHPRLMFRTSAWQDAPTVAEVAARVDREPYARWFGRLGTGEFHTGALYSLILKERGETRQAGIAADSVIARMLALPEGRGNFFFGENLMRMSLAWDWLYDHPGFTAARKERLRARMLAMAEKLISKTPDGREIVYGEEIFHNYCSNAALAVGMTGLALWRGPGDNEAGRLIRIAREWYFERSFRAMELLGGAWHEGMAYSLNHVIQETPIWVASWRTATGEDWFARIKREQGNWMEEWIYFCLANLRPDYTFVRTADNGRSRMLPDLTLRQAIELIVAAYGNRHGQFLLNELEERLGEASLASGDIWMPLLFHDDRLEATDYRELNPSRIFSPDRLGFVTMRSGWGPDDTFVHFKSGDYFGSHNHLDQNHFTIYHRGDLALDSGGYDGYGTHREMYAYRSIAHNTILVRDPEEKALSHYFDPWPSPGGQRSMDYYFNNSNHDPSLYWEQYRDKAHADMADITAWETQADFDFVTGDATAAYNSTVVTESGARPKISRFTRRLLFVKPDIVAVCDNVDAVVASFQKHWLLHTAEEPYIAGDYTVTVEHGEGRMTLQAVLPEDVFVNRYGGPGREFLVNGVNHPLNKNQYGWPAEPGAWRLELTCSSPREQDIFLVMMQMGERGELPLRCFNRLENDELVGAVSADLCLLFTRDRIPGAPPAGTLNLPAGIPPGCRVYIAGLEKNGVYRVRYGSAERGIFSAGDGGVLRLNLNDYSRIHLVRDGSPGRR